MKIKILYVIKNFAVNGISTVISNYIQFLDKKNFDITVFAGLPIEENYIHLCEKYGVKLVEAPNKDCNRKAYYKSLNLLMKSNNFDIVHVHGSSRLLFTELLIAKRNKIKVRIVHSHNTKCSHKFLNFLSTPLFNILYTDAFACGQEAGKWLFGKKKFLVINNGIDVKKYIYDSQRRIKIRKEKNLSNYKLIGHVGSFIVQKNHLYMLKILKKLIEIDSNYKLVLLGTGSKFNEIINMSKQMNLYDNVVFVGKTQEVSDWLQAMDIMIIPSKYEGFPMVMVEWQSMGLNIIASDKITKKAALTDLVHYLPIDDDSIDLWVQCIQKYSCQKNDRKKYHMEIASMGFDIRNDINVLEQYYVEKMKKYEKYKSTNKR